MRTPHVGADGAVTRRGFLAAAGAGAFGWKGALALRAAESRRRVACIVLWMGGGPS